MATSPTHPATSLPGRESDADGGGDSGGRTLEFKQGSRDPPGANPEVIHSPPRLSSVPTLSSNAVRSSSASPPGPSQPLTFDSTQIDKENSLNAPTIKTKHKSGGFAFPLSEPLTPAGSTRSLSSYAL